MNNYAEHITPEQAAELNPDVLLEEWRARAKVTGLCSVCETERIWRYAGLKMCFTCTTGEADASDDYELIANYGE